MAQTEVFLFRDEHGSIPLIDWLDGLPARVRDKCTGRISRLAELGHELRRPEADFVTEGIYELRAAYQNVHYRMLYFFSGRAVVVLSHGLAKEKEVPKREIDRAIERRKIIESDFKKFTVKPR